MLDPTSIFFASIPQVDEEALERFYRELTQRPVNSGVGYTAQAILQISGEATTDDPVAIYARATLITILAEHHFLDSWKKGVELDGVVFKWAAKFPLPGGLEQFSADEFVIALKK